jgi:hypothetical protein
MSRHCGPNHRITAHNPSMSVMAIFRQQSDFSAGWRKPRAAVSRSIGLDNGSFWAQSCRRVAGSHLLANLSSPS